TVLSHHCLAFRSSGSRLRSYSSSISLASSTVGFFGIISSLGNLRCDSTLLAAEVFLCHFRVSGNATLSSRQRTQASPQSPLALARSLFDSMASAFSICGIKIALMLCGKARPPHLNNTPQGGFREKDRSYARESQHLADFRLPVEDARCRLEPGRPGMGTRSGNVRPA